MTKLAVFPGSFDPFTNGHLDIIRKAAPLFDNIFIVIGINADKKRKSVPDKMKCAIEKALAESGIANCSVAVYDGLTAKYAAEHNISYIIRGLRNSTDYCYEENIAEVNSLINPSLECIYFRADNTGISSSMVRELHSFGEDVSAYVPRAVFDLMNRSQNE